MLTYTHVHIQWREEVGSYRQSGWGRGGFSVVFTLSMYGFYKNTKAITFLNLENTTKLLFIDTLSLLANLGFPLNNSTAAAIKKGTHLRDARPPRFPRNPGRRWGEKRAPLLDQAEIPALSFLTWSAILEGSLLTTL